MNKLLILVFTIAILGGCQRGNREETSSPGEQPQPIPAQDVENYLAANIGETGFDGIVFCAYDVLCTEQKDNVTTLYLWTLCLEYYQEHSRLGQGTGISAPVAIIWQEQRGSLRILEHKIPRDGADYGKDVKSIFPRSVWPQILPSSSSEIDDFNARVKALESRVAEKARAFFETTN